MTSRRRALLSVSDKRGLDRLGRALHEGGWELVASGGTARALEAAGVPVTPVAEVTGARELLGGRVKTLHPALHAGILARPDEADEAELDAEGLGAFGLVVCNLYPFEEACERGERHAGELVEAIDVGGVALLRAAAKNAAAVSVLCDPDDYDDVVARLAEGGPDARTRRRLALKAFRRTAAYDAAVAGWLEAELGDDAELLPERLPVAAERVETLRYGENPHQQAALYRTPGRPLPFSQLQGKGLSYNNVLDLDAARAIPPELDAPAAVVVKHGNPCGLAIADDAATAVQRAVAADPVSAFGSVVATNRVVDEAFVDALGALFVEVLAAPGYTGGAREALAARRKRCRVLQDEGTTGSRLRLRSAAGGLLAQSPDDRGAEGARGGPAGAGGHRGGGGGDEAGNTGTWRVVTATAPDVRQWADLAFAWVAVKHVRSNAIVLAADGATVGLGMGQANRVDAVRHAAARAGDAARGAVVASDAFFPFPDGLRAAAEAGATACVQPGGSKRDDEVVAAADELGVAMVFTGERHFRH